MTNIIQFPRRPSREYLNECKMHLLGLHSERKISDACFKREMQMIGLMRGVGHTAQIIKFNCF